MTKHILLAAALFLNSTISYAWTISRLKGEVSIKRNDKTTPVQEGEALQLNDLVITGRDSRVQLIEGESQLWLSSRTKFKITESKSSTDSPKLLNLMYGKLRAAVHKDTAKSYQYKTPTAVSGVRGTEFFMAVDENQDTICTLEGAVEVQYQSGEVYVVNKGKGLALKPGDKPKVSDNSSFLVDQWVAETSFDKMPFVLPNVYSNEAPKHKVANSNWHYGGTANAYYCGSKERDFNKNITDLAYDCFRSYLSPFIQYGVNNKIFFRPAILNVSNARKSRVDEMPMTLARGGTQATIAELYAEQIKESWSYKIGLQDIEWADGVLLSKRMWSNEPLTHLALTAKTSVADWDYEFLYGPGHDDDTKLRGHSHIATLGLKADAPKKLATLYIVNEDYGDLEPGQSALYHGHEILNYGLYSTRKINNFDYTASAIYQRHNKHHTTTNMPGETDGHMFDLGLGHHFQVASTPLRISLRYIYASEDFTPGTEDYYALGAANFVTARANLEQHRAKLEWQFRSQHLVSFEYLSSYELSDQGFIRQLSTVGKNQYIGTEHNLAYRYELKPHWRLYAGLWSFTPSIHQSGDDTSTGEYARVEYTY